MSDSRDRDDRRDRDRYREKDNYKRKREDEDRKYDRDRDRDYDRDRRDRDYDRNRKDRDRERDREKERDDSSPKRVKSEDGGNEETASTKKLPMDVEDLLKKKQEEESKTSKPVFLSKEERQKLALAKRAAEVEEKMKVIDEQKKLREKFFQEAQTSLSDDKPREKERDRDRDRDRERRDRERKDREKKDRDVDKEKDKKKETTETDTQMDPKELEQMKLAYLGQKKEKKKIIKPSEKFKFVFDWDEDEDTSKDLNPLYNAKPDIRPQFGRGLFGGIDPTEQLKDYEEKKKKIMSKTAMEADRPQKHWTEKELREMSARDWRIFLEDYNISTKGGSIPHPIRNWKEGNFRKEIYDAIEKIGFKTPTGIQMQAIPIALQGRDLIGIAETGSGKTAAFVIPMLEYIMKLPPMTAATELEGPYALILAPTRELAVQIEQDTSKFASHCNIRTLCIVGGISIEEQALQLRKGCEVVIATPGRLNDLIESRYLALNQCTYVVLDEADKMIDMGFESQVTAILDYMPVSNLKSEDDSIAEIQENEAVKGRYRTTIMYSATMPPAVEKLAKKYLRRPAQVIVGVVGRAVDRITQKIEFVKDDGSKMKKLVEILTDGPPPPIIVFVNHKKTCDGITKHIERFGFKPIALHSGRGQFQREAAIEGFKAGKYDILIATDVAGRGIDVKGVTHVINYDMPKNIQDFTHRVGRTGRAGMEGLATSFLTNDDAHIFYDLVQMLRSTENFVPNELAQHPAASVKPGEIDSKKRRDTVIYAKK